MIEYRKKTDDDFYKLDKNLYSVVTASLQQLEAQPQVRRLSNDYVKNIKTLKLYKNTTFTPFSEDSFFCR